MQQQATLSHENVHFSDWTMKGRRTSTLRVVCTYSACANTPCQLASSALARAGSAPARGPARLEAPRLGERAVEDSEQRLVRNVRPVQRRVLAVLAQERGVVIAVEQLVALRGAHARVSRASTHRSGPVHKSGVRMRRSSRGARLADFGGLQAGALEHKDDALALRGLGARLLLFTRRRQAADHAWGALWGKTS